MKSPLSVDEQTAKDSKITPDIELTPVQKVSFLQSQKEELLAMQWRSRVDVIHATRLQESDNPVLKAKGNNNYAEHMNQVEQFTGAIAMINKLIEELRETYEELKVKD